MGWLQWGQKRRVEVWRKQRLQEKMQKAHVEDQAEEVKSADTWNGKFRKVQSIKGGRVG